MANKIDWDKLMEPVSSSNIVARGYHPKTHKMRIQFRSGLYEYSNVSQKFYDDFKLAESAGKFFQAHKAGLTEYTKIA